VRWTLAFALAAHRSSAMRLRVAFRLMEVVPQELLPAAV
jgi:hypothetical protein